MARPYRDDLDACLDDGAGPEGSETAAESAVVTHNEDDHAEREEEDEEVCYNSKPPTPNHNYQTKSECKASSSSLSAMGSITDNFSLSGNMHPTPAAMNDQIAQAQGLDQVAAYDGSLFSHGPFIPAQEKAVGVAAAAAAKEDETPARYAQFHDKDEFDVFFQLQQQNQQEGAALAKKKMPPRSDRKQSPHGPTHGFAAALDIDPDRSRRPRIYQEEVTGKNLNHSFDELRSMDAAGTQPTATKSPDGKKSFLALQSVKAAASMLSQKFPTEDDEDSEEGETETSSEEDEEEEENSEKDKNDEEGTEEAEAKCTSVKVGQEISTADATVKGERNGAEKKEFKVGRAAEENGASSAAEGGVGALNMEEKGDESDEPFCYDDDDGDDGCHVCPSEEEQAPNDNVQKPRQDNCSRSLRKKTTLASSGRKHPQTGDLSPYPKPPTPPISGQNSTKKKNETPPPKDNCQDSDPAKMFSISSRPMTSVSAPCDTQSTTGRSLDHILMTPSAQSPPLNANASALSGKDDGPNHTTTSASTNLQSPNLNAAMELCPMDASASEKPYKQSASSDKSTLPGKKTNSTGRKTLHIYKAKAGKSCSQQRQHGRIPSDRETEKNNSSKQLQTKMNRRLPICANKDKYEGNNHSSNSPTKVNSATDKENRKSIACNNATKKESAATKKETTPKLSNSTQPEKSSTITTPKPSSASHPTAQAIDSNSQKVASSISGTKSKKQGEDSAPACTGSTPNRENENVNTDDIGSTKEVHQSNVVSSPSSKMDSISKEDGLPIDSVEKQDECRDMHRNCGGSGEKNDADDNGLDNQPDASKAEVERLAMKQHLQHSASHLVGKTPERPQRQTSASSHYSSTSAPNSKASKLPLSIARSSPKYNDESSTSSAQSSVRTESSSCASNSYAGSENLEAPYEIASLMQGWNFDRLFDPLIDFKEKTKLEKIPDPRDGVGPMGKDDTDNGQVCKQLIETLDVRYPRPGAFPVETYAGVLGFRPSLSQFDPSSDQLEKAGDEDKEYKSPWVFHRLIVDMIASRGKGNTFSGPSTKAEEEKMKQAFVGIRMKPNKGSNFDCQFIDKEGREILDKYVRLDDYSKPDEWKVINSFSTNSSAILRKKIELANLETKLAGRTRELLQCAEKECQEYDPEKSLEQADIHKKYEKLLENQQANNLMSNYNQLEEDMEMTCCVCELELGHGYPIVICDGEGCNVAVHKQCYFIDEIPRGKFYCYPCQRREKNPRSKNANPVCDLCPVPGGAFLPCEMPHGGSAADRWVHASCVKHQKLHVKPNKTVDARHVDEIVNQCRWQGSACCLCRGKYGAMTKCLALGCTEMMHATCAILSICSEHECSSSGLFCPRHTREPPPCCEGSMESIPTEEEFAEAIPLETLIAYAEKYPDMHMNFPALTRSEQKTFMANPKNESSLIADLNALHAGASCDVCGCHTVGIYLDRCASCHSSICVNCKLPSELLEAGERKSDFLCSMCKHLGAPEKEISEFPSCSVCYQKDGWTRRAKPKGLRGEERWCHSLCARYVSFDSLGIIAVH